MQAKAQGQGSKNPPAPMNSRFQEYAKVLALFWGFLVLTAVVSFFTCGAVWDDVTAGTMEFLFIILGGGFTLVAALDYFYEEYFAKTPLEGKK